MLRGRRVEERPIPTLQTENDVLVKVVSSGLCGSDIPRIFAKGAHYYPSPWVMSSAAMLNLTAQR
jgi:threonine dehydrogenase-like Zn-dependent dehydrogenase